MNAIIIGFVGWMLLAIALALTLHWLRRISRLRSQNSELQARLVGIILSRED